MAPPGVVSFQATSGMYESAEPSAASFSGFQYVPVASLNLVPPTDVTSGTEAGNATASPCVAAVSFLMPPSHAAAPSSPELMKTVIPCAFACFARLSSLAASAADSSPSQSP